MLRPTLANFMASDGPQSIGACRTDTAACAAAVNGATQRLLFAREVGDSGWVGTWSEIAFTATREDPFITAPFDVARIESLNLCTFPVEVSNQFHEYLRFGFGRWPKATCSDGRPQGCNPLQAFDRGRVPLFSDIVPPGKKVRVYPGDSGDVDKRVLLQSLDDNDQVRYSLDGTIQVTGDMLTLVAPFVDSPANVSRVTGIIKDVTIAPVSFYEVDNDTAEQRLILTMQPGETTASYRRYYLSGLPRTCCNPPTDDTTVQLTALCQMAYVPVAVPTDWLNIPSVEALVHECQCGRYLRMDAPNAKDMAAFHHTQAIRLLNGQSVHEYGESSPAVEFAPFGASRFVSIGFR